MNLRLHQFHAHAAILTAVNRCSSNTAGYELRIRFFFQFFDIFAAELGRLPQRSYEIHESISALRSFIFFG